MGHLFAATAKPLGTRDQSKGSSSSLQRFYCDGCVDRLGRCETCVARHKQCVSNTCFCSRHVVLKELGALPFPGLRSEPNHQCDHAHCASDHVCSDFNLPMQGEVLLLMPLALRSKVILASVKLLEKTTEPRNAWRRHCMSIIRADIADTARSLEELHHQADAIVSVNQPIYTSPMVFL